MLVLRTMALLAGFCGVCVESPWQKAGPSEVGCDQVSAGLCHFPHPFIPAPPGERGATATAERQVRVVQQLLQVACISVVSCAGVKAVCVLPSGAVVNVAWWVLLSPWEKVGVTGFLFKEDCMQFL